MRRSIIFALAALLALPSCGKKTDAPNSPAALAAADIGAASPLDKSYRLKSGKDVDVERLFEVFPLYLRPTYETAAFDKGLGATVVTNLKFGDIAASKGFTAKRAEFYGADLEKIERIGAAKDAPVDAPLALVLGKLRMFDIESAGENGARTTIGAAEINSLRIREGGIPEEPPGSGLAFFFNAFDVAGLYFKDVKTTATGEQTAGADFSAADLRFVGIGGGKLKALLARDLDYVIRQSPDAIAAAGRGMGPMGDILVNGPLRNFIAPENQRTKFGALEWRDISFAGLMAFGLKGERPPASARNLINLGTARIVDAETFIGEKRLSIVPATEISAMEFTWLAPSKVRAVTRGGLYDFTAYVPDTEKEAIAALKSRKLDKVKGDSDFAFDWSADKGAAVVSTGFDSAGFADFDLDLALEGLDLKKIEAARAAGAAKPVPELARLKSFSMILADEQMLDAFYALSALEAGQSEKEIRAAMPTLMRLGKMEIERESPRLASYIDAAADFLENGGTLEIKAQPATPVPFERHHRRRAGRTGCDGRGDQSDGRSEKIGLVRSADDHRARRIARAEARYDADFADRKIAAMFMEGDDRAR